MVLVDAAQSVPHLTTDVQAMDVDFLVFSGHKMLGPIGRGRALRPARTAGGHAAVSGRREHDPPRAIGRFEPADLPAKFEAGTPPIVPAIGLGTAIDYLQKIGLDTIARSRAAADRSGPRGPGQASSGVRILGPRPEHKAGIVSFTLDGHPRPRRCPSGRSPRRRRPRRASLRHAAAQAYDVGATARASFYLYNTLAEVEQLGPAVEAAKRVFHRKRK